MTIFSYHNLIKYFVCFTLAYFIKWCSIIPGECWDLKLWTLYFLCYSVHQASAFGSACTGFEVRNYINIIHNGLWILLLVLSFDVFNHLWVLPSSLFSNKRWNFLFLKNKSRPFFNVKSSKNFSTHSKYNRNI